MQETPWRGWRQREPTLCASATMPTLNETPHMDLEVLPGTKIIVLRCPFIADPLVAKHCKEIIRIHIILLGLVILATVLNRTMPSLYSNSSTLLWIDLGVLVFVTTLCSYCAYYAITYRDLICRFSTRALWLNRILNLLGTVFSFLFTVIFITSSYQFGVLFNIMFSTLYLAAESRARVIQALSRPPYLTNKI